MDVSAFERESQKLLARLKVESATGCTNYENTVKEIMDLVHKKMESKK